MTAVELEIGFRGLSDGDVSSVLRIDMHSYDDCWTEDDLRDSLRRRNCIGMVAVVDKKVVGYYVMDLFEDYVNVFRFAVHPDYRRQGVGSRMLKKLEAKISDGRRTSLLFEIRETLLDGQLFLKSRGMKAVKVTRNYYDDKEDCYVFLRKRSELPV